MKKRILALVLCLIMGLSLTACRPDSGNVQTSPTPGTVETPPASDPTPDAAPTPEDNQPDEVVKAEVDFAVLSGPTGVGAAKLLADNEADKTANRYNVTLAADNQEIAGKLTNGDLDIACMASNMAANLYNKNKGSIQALCLSTLGVLYILERGDAAPITSMSDLAGKDIFATGEGANPQYVLEHLLRENGVDPANDVNIVWQDAQSVQANLISGDAQYAMLPVPAATAAQIQGKANGVDIRSALDLTEEWDRISSDSILTMTTVVVRTEFAKENPEAVEAFLKEYAASIEYVNSNVEEASKLVEQFGIVPKAAIAAKAIPDCNLVYIAGEQMRDQIQGYYQVLYMANPASIGGGIPDDAFYYLSRLG